MLKVKEAQLRQFLGQYLHVDLKEAHKTDNQDPISYEAPSISSHSRASSTGQVSEKNPSRLYTPQPHMA